MKPGHEMIPTNMRRNPVHPNTFWGGGLACRGSKHITRYSEDFVCLGEADSSHLVFLRPLFRHQNMKQIRSCDGIPIWVFGAIQKRSDKTRQWQVLSSVFLVLVGHRNIRNLRSACFSVHFVSSRTLTIQGFDRILDSRLRFFRSVTSPRRRMFSTWIAAKSCCCWSMICCCLSISFFCCSINKRSSLRGRTALSTLDPRHMLDTFNDKM